jgi:hypothetical protein
LMALACVGMVVGMVLGSSGLFALLVVLRRRKYGLGAGSPRQVEDVNVFGGLVLPVPDDCRWRGNSKQLSFGGGDHLLIEVVDGWLLIAGRRLPSGPHTYKYCKAVMAAFRRKQLGELSRKVDEAVEHSEICEPSSGGSMGPSSSGDLGVRLGSKLRME